MAIEGIDNKTLFTELSKAKYLAIEEGKLKVIKSETYNLSQMIYYPSNTNSELRFDPYYIQESTRLYDKEIPFFDKVIFLSRMKFKDLLGLFNVNMLDKESQKKVEDWQAENRHLTLEEMYNRYYSKNYF